MCVRIENITSLMIYLINFDKLDFSSAIGQSLLYPINSKKYPFCNHYRYNLWETIMRASLLRCPPCSVTPRFYVF